MKSKEQLAWKVSLALLISVFKLIVSNTIMIPKQLYIALIYVLPGLNNLTNLRNLRIESNHIEGFKSLHGTKDF